MGSEDGLERLDQVRHLATPALVKTSPAEAVLAHQDGLDPPFPAVQGYALPKESKSIPLLAIRNSYLLAYKKTGGSFESPKVPLPSASLA